MSQKALEIAKKNDENSFFSFAYPYPIIMSIGKILCYIRVYSIHISQKTFNFAAENDNNIKLYEKNYFVYIYVVHGNGIYSCTRES